MDLSKHMLFQSVRLVGAVGIEPATLDSSITHLNSACVTATQERKR